MSTFTCQECRRKFPLPANLDALGEFSFKYTQTHCETCMGLIEQKKKNNFERLQEHERMKQWLKLCPPLYQDSDMDRMPSGQGARVLSWKPGPHGLVLIGPSGTCKTRLAFLLLRRLVLTEGLSVAAFHGNSFAHQCAREFGNQTGEAWIARLAKKDVVFFDDLGKFKLTERVEAELFGLIEMRSANLKPIIATTNMHGNDMVAKLTPDRGEPLVRRLREFCEVVVF